ncbi:MAG: hypothetical protein H8E55_52270 [Pelagibacterales bacterium]|nr:hypothetical protein [Pelagibacterales bacterium]
MVDKKTVIGKILTLFKWFDIPLTLFFVGILTVIGIFGSWVYAIGLIVLAIIGITSGVVAMLLGDYLDEQQDLKKNPYFKFFIVRLVWVVLFALMFISVLKLIP